VPDRLRVIGATDDADRVETMFAEGLLRGGAAGEAEVLLTGCSSGCRSIHRVGRWRLAEGWLCRARTHDR
jgi:hypothetical protein